MSGNSTNAHYQAVFGRYFESPANLAPGAAFLWVYVDSHSYGPGDEVTVHISTSVKRLRATVTRDGAIPATVLTFANIAGSAHDTPDQV